MMSSSLAHLLSPAGFNRRFPLCDHHPNHDIELRVNLTYRSLRREEIPIAVEVFLVSLTELAKNHGLPPPTNFGRASVEALYEHLFETGIFEVAELDGQLVGIAAGIVRDELWFLSMFWLLPEHKLRGIGQPLLERVLELAKAAGATKCATWSSLDFTAVALYLKHGMLPGGPIFTFAGPILHAPELDPNARVSTLDETHACAIDHIVRGTPRALDHAFWRARGVPGFQVEVSGRTLGYFYSDKGVIGPAAWLSDEDGPLLVASALAQARTQAPEVKLIALGLNRTSVRAATAAGLRLISASHFLHSESFGKLEQYLPSGPGLF
jgi:GNAT superfamily N-acetyltransferase